MDHLNPRPSSPDPRQGPQPHRKNRRLRRPGDLNAPGKIFLGPGQNLWIYNLGNRTFSILEDDRIQRRIPVRQDGIPVSQSTVDPNLFGFLTGWHEIYQINQREGDVFHAVAKGGYIGKTSQKLGRFYQSHLILPFANDKVLWADSLDLTLYLDEKEIITIEPTGRRPRLSKDPFQFQKALPHLDRFYLPGCFLYKTDQAEIAVITIENTLHAETVYRRFLIDKHP